MSETSSHKGGCHCGNLGLTFINTGTRRSPRLESYADLIAWAGTHGALSPAETNRLERLAVGRPEDAAAAFAAAVGHEDVRVLADRDRTGRAGEVDGFLGAHSSLP
jgi:hypothetical protein